MDKEGKPIVILLVEDNLGDVRLTREALKESKIRNNLQVVRDGEEAMDFLWKKGDFVNRPRPDLILLDLNLPKKSGREILKELKSDDNLKRIPVVILTVSDAEEDILGSYNNYANCYITKPINMEQFEKVVKTIDEFWFTIVKLPPDGCE